MINTIALSPAESAKVAQLEDSLSRRLSTAYAKRRSAETDNEWNAYDRLITELEAELSDDSWMDNHPGM